MFYIIPKETYGKKDVDDVNALLQNYCKKYLHSKKLELNLVSVNDSGLLYELDYSKFNREDEYIGDIMLKFLNLILKDGNLYLAQYNATLEIFENGLPKNHIILQEEILFQNMTLEEKKKKIDDYISKINVSNKDIIVIIDQYLFSKNSNDEYVNYLIDSLNNLNFSKLIIITNNKSFDESIFENVKSQLYSENISIYFSDNYHDRFWISDCGKGFTIGTSLNGVGKKISRISFLEDDEVIELLDNINKYFNFQDVIIRDLNMN